MNIINATFMLFGKRQNVKLNQAIIFEDSADTVYCNIKVGFEIYTICIKLNTENNAQFLCDLINFKLSTDSDVDLSTYDIGFYGFDLPINYRDFQKCS